MAEPGTRDLDGVDDLVYRLVLAKDRFLDVVAKRLEPRPFIGDDGLWRDLCHAGDGVFDHLHRYFFRPAARGQQLDRRTDLVDHIDRLVRQKAVVDVFSGKLGGRSQRFVAVFYAVMLLVKFLEALEYLVGLFDRRLVDLDPLKTPCKRPVAVKCGLVFGMCRRADTSQIARRRVRVLECSTHPSSRPKPLRHRRSCGSRR